MEGYWYSLYVAAGIEAAADDVCPDDSIDTFDCNFQMNCVELQHDGSASSVETEGDIGVHSLEVGEGDKVNRYRFVHSVLAEEAAECHFACIDEKKTMS